MLPYPQIMWLGKSLGLLLFRLSKRRVGIARANLELCFPQLDEARREQLVREHFISSGKSLMEVAMAWWMPPTRLDELIELAGHEQIDRAFARGKGVIFLSAHFSALELGGRALRLLTDFRPMYRPHENPVVERFFHHSRARRFGEPLRRDDVKGMLRSLAQNQGVWFAPDQNFSRKSRVFAPFFGQPAATNPATSRFARISGAVVLPYVLLRKADGSGYRVLLGPELDDFPSADPERDATAINRQIEHWVRLAPEQYYWMHRRFKTRPDGMASVYP